MEQKRRLSWREIGRKLRRPFLTGLLVIIPIGATVLILVWIFNSVDNILQPVIKLVWGHPVPGVGFGITIVLIYLIGVIASNVIGRRLIHYAESLVARVPLVRPLYSSIKQMVTGFSTPGTSGFTEAVLVEFPRKGMWTIGFVTNESSLRSGERYLNIFIPTAPNPVGGFLQIVREDEVIRTNLSIDEAVKMVISAGKVSPEGISDWLSKKMQ